MTTSLLISAPGFPCYQAIAASQATGGTKIAGASRAVATGIGQMEVPLASRFNIVQAEARALALEPTAVIAEAGVAIKSAAREDVPAFRGQQINSAADLRQVTAQVGVADNNDKSGMSAWASLAKFWERAEPRHTDNSTTVFAPAIVSQKISGLSPASRPSRFTQLAAVAASALALPAAAVAAEPGKVLTASAWHLSTTGTILLALGAVIAIVVAVKNWRSTSEYPAVTGARWRMNKGFARKLVDEGRFFMIPLNSGMQTPVIDAVEYLADTKDTDSIPRVRKLFDKFTFGADTESFDGGWGPMDYMPPLIQAVAAEALLKLLPLPQAKEFAITALTKIGARHLGRDTVTNLLGFLKAQRMRETAPVLLDQAEKERAVFDRKLADYQGGSSRGLTYAGLYKYEDMAYAAYQLAADARLKEMALQMLIAEYNHADANINYDHPTGRPHDHIDIIVSQIVDHDLADDPVNLSRVKALLDQRRLGKDMDSYRRLKEIHNKPVLIDLIPD